MTTAMKAETNGAGTPEAQQQPVMTSHDALNILNSVTQGPLVDANGAPLGRNGYIQVAQAIQVLADLIGV